MNRNTTKLLFALIRSAIGGSLLNDSEKALYKEEVLPDLLELSSKHDVVHLVALGLKTNDMLTEETIGLSGEIMAAVYRYEQLNYEYCKLCEALEKAEIPFLPLKGSVIRKYYKEPWMRTSCDIDILIHKEDIDRTIEYLKESEQYVEKKRTNHDIAFSSKQGKTIELHFDLVEEGLAKNANVILRTVWDNVSVKGGYSYWHEMPDELFYFYHIAHMAKHFENGGCGIRPFIDLYILNNISDFDKAKRDELLEKGGLIKFSKAVCDLSDCWFDGKAYSEILKCAENYIFGGGVYGSKDNRTIIQQNKKGGKFNYMLSRVFMPYNQLKTLYPILDNHRYLTPVVQTHRWFKLIFGGKIKSSVDEFKNISSVSAEKANEVKSFFENIGL